MQTRIKIIKNRSLDVQKGANNEVTFMLYSPCSVVFRLSHGNSHTAPKGRRLIVYIYPKDNSYLLMDRAYEDNKTLALS